MSYSIFSINRVSCETGTVLSTIYIDVLLSLTFNLIFKVFFIFFVLLPPRFLFFFGLFTGLFFLLDSGILFLLSLSALLFNQLLLFSLLSFSFGLLSLRFFCQNTSLFLASLFFYECNSSSFSSASLCFLLSLNLSLLFEFKLSFFFLFSSDSCCFG